ncbi:Uncharacterised protein [Corynebacterium kutscheri]|uniref:hypothetical protein n=1 Tax=Corynebacterium kutscheri TaxID=35755 RepID=UPI000F6B3E2D|nr:hypothetical protein [Corynebacterium kutscheri]VEH79797.1 Uncharacterised protein [Corynebacterium kutscheri]
MWDGEPILATTGDKYSVRTLNNTAYRVHSQKYAWHSPHVNIQKIEKRKEILRNGIFGGLFGLTLTIGLLVASPTAEEPVGTPATVARVNTQ